MPNTVYIETKNPGGGLQDGVPFHLALICPLTTGSRFSVVRATGTQQRGAAGNSSIRTATGRYTVAPTETSTPAQQSPPKGR